MLFSVALLVILYCEMSFGIMITGVVDEERMIDEVEVRPQLYDILLTDLPVAKMKLKTKEVFKFEYNSPFSGGLGDWPIKGVILEDTKMRLVIPIVAKYKKKNIQTTCVVDTGSPWTFFSKETFAAMGISDVTDSYAQVVVQGLPIPVYESTKHFADINVCGSSFFSSNLVYLNVNYRKRKVLLEKTADLTEEDAEEL